MANVTAKSLEEKHPGKGVEMFREICRLGGCGDVDPNYPGGLDIGGALKSDAISDENKARIKRLASGAAEDPDADTKPVKKVATNTKPINPSTVIETHGQEGE